MNATLHLPDGRRVRTATGRGFVVVVDHVEKPKVLYRTDNLVKARARRHKESERFSSASPLFVFDTLAPASPLYPEGF